MCHVLHYTVTQSERQKRKDSEIFTFSTGQHDNLTVQSEMCLLRQCLCRLSL